MNRRTAPGAIALGVLATLPAGREQQPVKVAPHSCDRLPCSPMSALEGQPGTACDRCHRTRAAL